MENTQNTIAQAAASASTAPKAKRAYHRLTEEEKAQRAEEFAAYKAGVAARKAERQAKRDAAAKVFAERRDVKLDLSSVVSAMDAFKNGATVDVKTARANVSAVLAAAQSIEKQLHHRSKNTVVAIIK